MPALGGPAAFAVDRASEFVHKMPASVTDSVAYLGNPKFRSLEQDSAFVQGSAACSGACWGDWCWNSLDKLQLWRHHAVVTEYSDWPKIPR